MIEIQEALQLIDEQSSVLPLASRSLEDLPQHVLAESLSSDVDSPPFDKSMMDGFAIRSDDVAQPNTELKIVGRITAGTEFEGRVNAGEAVKIMTGAPVPAGADAVVMVEQTAESDDVVCIEADVNPRQNIMHRGSAMQVGQNIINQGHQVRAEDIGLLAEAGICTASVVARPRLSIIATGDELISVSEKPTGSQIRNSNGPMLSSLARPYCSEVVNLGIGPDDPEQLGQLITSGLQTDVLVLSGGVSAGVADLVPGLLQQAGVQQIFHKVKIKPGKPVWFGVLPRASMTPSLVFGLPGNPVSSMVCFRVFVAAALRKMAGQEFKTEYVTAELEAPHQQRPGRTTYWPCIASPKNTKPVEIGVTPLNWKGSADLTTLATANCFGIFDGEKASFSTGEPIPLLPIGRDFSALQSGRNRKFND